MNLEKLDYLLFTLKRLKKAQEVSLNACDRAGTAGGGNKRWTRAAQERDVLERMAREAAKDLFDLQG